MYSSSFRRTDTIVVSKLSKPPVAIKPPSNGLEIKPPGGLNRGFTLHTLIHFELASSLIVTVRCSPRIEFNNQLTNSNAQHPCAFSFSRGQKGQIFHCTLRDFAKLTYQIQLKSFKIYLIKFDLTINYNRKRQHINVSKVSTHPSLIKLNRPWCWTSQFRTQSLLAVWSAGQSSRRCPSDQKA